MKNLVLAALFAPTMASAQALESYPKEFLDMSIAMIKADTEYANVLKDMTCRTLLAAFTPGAAETNVQLMVSSYIYGRGVAIGDGGPNFVTYGICTKHPDMTIDEVFEHLAAKD